MCWPHFKSRINAHYFISNGFYVSLSLSLLFFFCFSRTKQNSHFNDSRFVRKMQNVQFIKLKCTVSSRCWQGLTDACILYVWNMWRDNAIFIVIVHVHFRSVGMSEEANNEWMNEWNYQNVELFRQTPSEFTNMRLFFRLDRTVNCFLLRLFINIFDIRGH